MKYLQKVFILLTASLAATLISATAYAATFTVDTASDELDGACPAGDCSLREAIAAASNGDSVTFDASLDGGTITLSGVLGTLTVDKTLTIDGDIDGGAGPDITIDGTGLSDNAVAVTAATVVMDGMVVWGGTTSGHNAISVSGASFTLKNSMVNTDGSINKKDISYAIRLNAANASIGTGVAGEGNQIGGSIHVNNTSGNSILGNHMGISSSGADIAPTLDQASGIEISGASALTTTIGGAGNSKNIISNFDSNNAIKITNSNSSTAVTISGNYLGTTVPGTAAAANQAGVYLSAEVTGTVNIGTSSLGNVISGNTVAGIYLAGGNSSTVTVLKNYIGTNDGGTTAVANPYGMTVGGCTTLTIGDSFNVISGNTTAGVYLANSSCAISMTGAYIGLGADGSTVIANGTGISVDSTGGSLAIGTAIGSVNVISGNTGHGISVGTSATITPTIRNNYIGLNAAGTAAKANGWDGIKLQKPANVYSNMISGNTWHGIQLTSTVTSSSIHANYIGLDAAGTSAVANAYTGIHVFGATGVAIGNSDIGANVISGNTQAGILIDSSGSATILNNKIGTNAAGTVTTVGNGNSVVAGSTLYYGGVMVSTASATIGSGTLGNTISGNYGQGVGAINPTSMTVKGNTISSNIAGATTQLANGSGVVVIDSVGGSASTIAIGGTGAGEGNTITGNAEHGVYVAHQTGGGGIATVTMYSNTIGSTGAANIIHGIFFKDIAPGGNITSVTIGSSSGPNTVTYNGSAGIKFDSMSSGTINSNTVSNNTVHGVHVYASSPTISTNTISSNGGNGIKVESDYGSDKSPSVTADDMRSTPTITGNTLTTNTAADIYSIDAAASNKSTLHTDNTITNTSGINGIEQIWYGALAYTCNGSAVTAGISSATVNGSSSSFATYGSGYWGPASVSTDVTTWGQIKEFIYTSSGGKTTYSHAITVTPSAVTSCTTATVGSGTFDGSSYYQTATVALTVDTVNTGGGTILFSSSRSSSRTTTTTETETAAEEEPSRDTTTEETSRDTTTEETSRDATTETEATRETPTYAREESYDRYSPSEATSTESTRETTTTTTTATTETLSERVEQVREILGVAEEATITEVVSRAIETITAGTADADNDGITNAEEATRGTNAYSADSDGDGDPDNRDPSPSDATVMSETWTELYETVDRDSNGDGMSDKAEYLFGAETTSRELVFGSANGDINLGFSLTATITQEGAVLTGIAKPNTTTRIDVTLNDGSIRSIYAETDDNGLYAAIFDSTTLGNLKDGDLLLITSETGKEVLAKVTNETIKKPEFKFEGSGIMETSAENNASKHWSTELVMNRIPKYLKQTSFWENYLEKFKEALEIAKKETFKLTGYTAEPNSAVIFVFKSATFSSVVISDKEGYFEMEVPSELKDELSQNTGIESILHEFIGFSVDYKTNKISSLTKGLFRIYNLKDQTI